MAYYNQMVASVLICLFVFHNDNIKGTGIVAVEGKQAESKVGRSIEASNLAIISTLFSDLTNKQLSDYNVHHAAWFTSRYIEHGTQARISVWGLSNVSYNSQSAVYIAALNEDGKNYAMISGFHVYPSLYSGNTDLRFFAGWKTGEGNGCFSTNCDGFVLSGVPGAPVPGGTFAPLSTYNGKDYFVTLKIKKDEKTQDWSLYRDDNDSPILIGWWPKTLFNNTFDYATRIVWGGGVLYPKNETSPPMGSGHWADERANRAAYVSHIKLFNGNGFIKDPDEDEIHHIRDRLDCFTLTGLYYKRGKGYHFYYGGPPGCKD